MNPRSTTRLRHPAVLLVSALAMLAGCAHHAGDDAVRGGTDADPMVARIDSLEITLSEVDGAIKDALFEEQFGGNYRSRLYDTRRQTLDELIDAHLLAEAADAANVSEAEWLATQVALLPPIDDEDVSQFFEANRERIGDGVTLDEMSERIRRHLVRLQEAQLVVGLRSGRTIEIALQRERIEVEAIGHTRGPEDARVTIVEFSDYQCPFCARAEPTLQTLLERYPNDVRLVYRHLPLDFHPDAFGAAQAAICADAQGRFWDFHALLFANQKKLGGEDLLGYAALLELDAAAFTACLDAPGTAEQIHRDIAAAQAAGATGTPAFFVNGVFISGAQPIEVFEAMLAAEGIDVAR